MSWNQILRAQFRILLLVYILVSIYEKRDFHFFFGGGDSCLLLPKQWHKNNTDPEIIQTAKSKVLHFITDEQ